MSKKQNKFNQRACGNFITLKFIYQFRIADSENGFYIEFPVIMDLGTQHFRIAFSDTECQYVTPGK